MNPRINKKQVAQMAGVSLRTMQRRPADFAFLKTCQAPGTARASYNARLVTEAMRKRKMI